MPENELPVKIADGAHLEGNEYGWDPSLFPTALANAQALSYACIGGQFQFRLDDGTCEMYWLSADSDPRHEAESWLQYCERSCSEVRTRFQKLMSETDFRKQALEWHPVREAMDHGLNPLEKLAFVAYFVNEAEWLEDERRRLLRRPDRP
jgi:hypothetical protein